MRERSDVYPRVFISEAWCRMEADAWSFKMPENAAHKATRPSTPKK